MELPVKPEESDCCNSDCNPCILDVYEEQLRKYNKWKLSNIEEAKIYTNCISKTSYSVFKVSHIEQHAEDALLISFEYVRPSKVSYDYKAESCRLCYEAGQYFLLKAGPKNDEFTKPYTPIPSEKNGTHGFTILIKLYEDGRMSRYIRRWSELKETYWRGPYGDFAINYTNRHMLFVSQGSGIAPVYSVICKLIDNEDCSTFIRLLYCCKSPRQIYLRNQLYKIQHNWNFTYEIFLSDSENLLKKYNETIHCSKLEFRVIQSYLEGKKGPLQVVICGSATFEAVIKEYVETCGVAGEDIFLL